MVQQRQETAPTKEPSSSWREVWLEYAGLGQIVSPRERRRQMEWDIVRELSERFEPLDETMFRIIDMRGRVSRLPRWDRAIYESLLELKEKVSDLQRQVEEITEAAREAGKIYNATIYELGNSRYELTVPIQIVLEESLEETVARIPELNLYASADTDSEAIYELKQEVIKLYEDLESSSRKLGPLPQSWLETLRRLIVRKNG